MVAYSPHSGTSIGEAVIITGAENAMIGVRAEYAWLKQQLGVRNQDWQLARQALMQNEARMYDVMDIVLGEDEQRTYYFDITDFFGKF